MTADQELHPEPVELGGAAAEESEPAVDPDLDHLVLAAPRLDRAVRDFAARTGVAPAPGGRHLGVGTRNFLVGLGGRAYLEIVGPDAEHSADPGVRRPFGIDTLQRPTLATWSVRRPNLAGATRAALSAGADLGPIRSMSRRGPDGVLHEWQVAYPLRAPFDGVVPFVIDWGTSVHPTAAELPQVELVELRGSHPDPERVRRVLQALGARLRLVPGPPRLEADLRTPYGTLTLS
jgi:hypothetical protein